jgi:hypothetical protein
MQFSELGVHIHFTLIWFHAASLHDDMGRGQLQVGNFRAKRPGTGKRTTWIPIKLILNVFQLCEFKQFKVIQYIVAKNSCAGCKKTFQNLKLCSRCNSILYCSKDCQRSHWPHHKLACNKNWISFDKISQGKDRAQLRNSLVISFPFYIWNLNSGNSVSHPLLHPPNF